MKDTYRYVIHAYEDARQKRPIKHEHGGTTVLTDGAEALGRAEELAREFPDGWVYIHLEYRGKLNSTSSPRSSRSLAPTASRRRGPSR
jgi:hypothetical protein